MMLWRLILSPPKGKKGIGGGSDKGSLPFWTP